MSTAGYGRRRGDLRGVQPMLEKDLPPTPPLANLYANAFEALIALAAILSAFAFFFSPGSLAKSLVGEALHPYDMVWNAMYLLGGLFVLAGLLVDHHLIFGRLAGMAVELSGLVFLGTATLVNLIALVAHAGVDEIRGVTTLSAVLLACIARSRSLVAPHKSHVPVPVPGGK